MINGVYAALSALDGFSTKTAVVSNNVANSNTDDYKKSRAVLEEGLNGGVEVSIQKIDTPGTPVSYEDNNTVGAEGASSAQTKETSNVDLAEETVQLITAQRGHEANLTSIKVQDEMQGSIIDILG